MNKLLYTAAFAIGLGVVGWVGAGYVHSQPLALAITLLIGAFYLMGALELQRFHRDSAALQHALTALGEAPAELELRLQPVRGLIDTLRRRPQDDDD